MSPGASKSMNKHLIIVFAKNPVKGRVKTRLARSVGEDQALEVYQKLLKVTESATQNSRLDTWVFFTDEIDHKRWPASKKFIQQGTDLGERMQHAFDQAFKFHYESVVLIGSDLPDMHEGLLLSAFEALKHQPVVFGPAADGGYYLLGLQKMIHSIFHEKPWSTKNLLSETLSELDEKQLNYAILETLNDIDTAEDLESSGFLKP